MESQTSDETDFEAELEKFYKKTDKLGQFISYSEPLSLQEMFLQRVKKR